MNEKIKIEVPSKFFDKNPAQLAEKLGGNQLPMQYFDGQEFPEEGGILTKFKIFLYPIKGWPAGPSLELLGVIKKLFLMPLRVAVELRWLPFCFLRKYRQRIFYRFMQVFIEISDQAFNLWYLSGEDGKGMCTFCREIYRKIGKWIDENVSDEQVISGQEGEKYTARYVWRRILLILVSVFEYDSAYRYRLQDLFIELNMKAFIENPIKELERLAKILERRERIGGVEMTKYLPFIKILKVVLFIRPKLKKALISMLKTLDLSSLSWQEYQDLFKDGFPDLPLQSKEQKIGRDHTDWYHCLAAPGYDFGGVPFHSRLSFKRHITTLWAKKHQEKAEELQKSGAMSRVHPQQGVDISIENKDN